MMLVATHIRHHLVMRTGFSGFMYKPLGSFSLGIFGVVFFSGVAYPSEKGLGLDWKTSWIGYSAYVTVLFWANDDMIQIFDVDFDHFQSIDERGIFPLPCFNITC
jgi:hypothetical protein